jgi:hypothetical protein
MSVEFELMVEQREADRQNILKMMMVQKIEANTEQELDMIL